MTFSAESAPDRDRDANAASVDPRFRTIADSLPVLVWIADRDQQGVWFNRSWLEFTGRRLEQEQGAGWIDGVHPEDRKVALDTCGRAFEAREPFSAVFRLRHADGSHRWVLDTGSPRFTTRGDFDGYVGSCVDITDRVEAEDALRRHDELLRFTIEAAGVGSWDWDITNDRMQWSPNLPAIHGRAELPDDLAGVMQDAHPDDREAFGATVQRALAGEDEFRVEYRLLIDGAERWVEGRGRVDRDEAGRPVRMAGVCADVTERKRVEQTLRQQAEQLREADRRKDEFLAMLAHELRNPLAPILSSAQVLRAHSDREVRNAVEVIERQVGHVVRLVDDLLDVARVTRGMIRLRPTTVRLRLAVADAVASVQSSCSARSIELCVDPIADDVAVRGDPSRLAQVFGNLLHNASKFTPAGGRIMLRVAAEQDAVEVVVQDDGHGIAADDLQRIFEPFHQSEPSLDRQTGGLGLGLTLVHRIVELHDGRVTAASAGIGKGSTFTVRLPRALAAASGDAAADRATEPRLGIGRRVLLVDDNQDAANTLALLVRMHGHDVRTAYDGNAAIDAARSYRPEVVVLDIGLPGLDGYQVARAIRSDSAGAPTPLLVALTGYGREDDRAQSMAAGFDHHLLKPVDAATLCALVATAGH